MREEKPKGKLSSVTRRSFLKGLSTGALVTTAASIGIGRQRDVEGHPLQVEEGVPKVAIRLNVNGLPYRLEVEPRRTLADVIRNDLGLTGTKIGCSRGECGACTILMEGRPVYSCTILAFQAQDKKIQTIESLSDGETLHPIQQAFIEKDAFQCGFCTPGMILSVKALLDRNLEPTREDVKRAISGNLCRCANYMHIIDASLEASKMMKNLPQSAVMGPFRA